MKSEGRRHLPMDEFLDLARKPGNHIFGYSKNEPPCRLEIVSSEQRIEVQVLGDLSLILVDRYRHLIPSRKKNNAGEWNCLSITWSQSPEETFSFATSLVDRVQLKNESLATAVDEGIQGFQDVLLQQQTLTTEREVGLYGELMVLNALASSIGPELALQSWLGPENEEHDFGLLTCDLEVKTTTQESRSHWISSATQLQPRPGIELRLVSIQLTPKFLGDGLTLPELVERVEVNFGRTAPLFWKRLDECGLKREHFNLYKRQWALRSDVCEFVVEGDFPRVTLIDLAKIGLDRPEIPEFQYKIVLQDRTPTTSILSVEKAFEDLRN